jgi:hypothetical protein
MLYILCLCVISKRSGEMKQINLRKPRNRGRNNFNGARAIKVAISLGAAQRPWRHCAACDRVCRLLYGYVSLDTWNGRHQLDAVSSSPTSSSGLRWWLRPSRRVSFAHCEV